MIALGARYGIDPIMVEQLKAMRPPSKWIHIVGNDQTVTEIDTFAALPQATEVMEQLQYTDRVFSQEGRFGRQVHFMSVEYSSKQRAQWARQRTNVREWSGRP